MHVYIMQRQAECGHKCRVIPTHCLGRSRFACNFAKWERYPTQGQSSAPDFRFQVCLLSCLQAASVFMIGCGNRMCANSWDGLPKHLIDSHPSCLNTCENKRVPSAIYGMKDASSCNASSTHGRESQYLEGMLQHEKSEAFIHIFPYLCDAGPCWHGS